MKKNPISAKLREALAKANPNANHTVPSESMRVVALAGNEVDLLIYGNIGDAWWDETSTTAQSVVATLAEQSPTTINVRINSTGGSVADGIAIGNELRRQSRAGVTVNGFVDGVAMSIASLIAACCDTITMPSNTIQMLHAPWGMLLIEGNAKDMREVSEEFAQVLDVMGSAMASDYARKSGKAPAVFTDMWDTGKDFYYTADEAKAFGLCDVVLDSADAATTAEPPTEVTETSDDMALELIARAPKEVRASLFAALRTPFVAKPVPTPNQPDTQASARATQPAPAGAPTGDPTVDEKTKKEQADAINAAAKTETQNAFAALRDRNTEIRALAEPHNGNTDVRAYVDDIVAQADPGVTAGDVGKQILAILAKGRTSMAGNAHISAGIDERDKRKSAMALAIQARTGAVKADDANPYRGMQLIEMARECVARAGANPRGMDRMEIVATAFTHTSSDFPGLLGDTARKALLKGYTGSEVDVSIIARPVSVSDFKPTTLAGLGAFSALDKVPEGQEYKYGTFSEQSQSIKLATYGKLFSVTRQAIINDDLSVLSDVPTKMGAAAKRTVIDAVFALLTSNPVLSDGNALFSAAHHNLVNPGTVISTQSVDALRALLALQTSPDGQIISVPLKTLVTPIALGGLARTVQTSQTEVGGSKNLTTPNIVRDTFAVLDNGRLDQNSVTAWYGVADPDIVDGLVIGYLDGNQEPYLGDSDKGFTVDGVAWKVRIDAAPAVADYRGLAKNPGA